MTDVSEARTPFEHHSPVDTFKEKGAGSKSTLDPWLRSSGSGFMQDRMRRDGRPAVPHNTDACLGSPRAELRKLTACNYSLGILSEPRCQSDPDRGVCTITTIVFSLKTQFAIQKNLHFSDKLI